MPKGIETPNIRPRGILLGELGVTVELGVSFEEALITG